MAQFSWTLYLNVANHLLQTPKEECLRSAVSRAYYAVFGDARARLEQRGIRFTESVHKKLIKWLRDPQQPPAVQRIGRGLDRLRKERNQADYDGALTWSFSMARQAVVLAQRLSNSTRGVWPDISNP